MAGRRKKNKNKVKTRHYVSVFTWFAILLAGIGTFVCAALFIFVWSANAYYVKEAENGKFHPEIESLFSRFDFPGRYVVWYNLGNYYYENGEYKDAEEAYLKAIECGIPYEKECPVRINLALSMMAQLSDDEWDAFFDCNGSGTLDAEARTVEKTLKDARDVLTADGCAHADDENGHSKEAQTLKDEIDELLEQSELEDEQEEPEPEEQEDGDEDEQEPEIEEVDITEVGMDEEEVMEHIQDMLDENENERTDDQQFYENVYGYGDGDSAVLGGQGEVW